MTSWGGLIGLNWRPDRIPTPGASYHEIYDPGAHYYAEDVRCIEQWRMTGYGAILAEERAA